MNTHPGLEKAGTYLNVQMGDTKTPWTDKPAHPFVTLSRESGTCGSSLARALAFRLNSDNPDQPPWTVFTANLIEEMLQSHHLSPRLARFLPEDRVPEIAAAVGELVGLHPNLWELVQKTNELMRRLARGGSVILVGRGANFATADVPHGVHVRLVAPFEHRARHLAHLRSIPEAVARDETRRRDHARERYVQANFNATLKDPCVYDLVINTATIPLSRAAALIAELVHDRTPAAAMQDARLSTSSPAI